MDEVEELAVSSVNDEKQKDKYKYVTYLIYFIYEKKYIYCNYFNISLYPSMIRFFHL